MRSPPIQMTARREGPQRKASARFHVHAAVVVNFGFTGNRRDSTGSPVSLHLVLPEANVSHNHGPSVKTEKSASVRRHRPRSDSSRLSTNDLFPLQDPAQDTTLHLARPYCFIAFRSLKKLWQIEESIELSARTGRSLYHLLANRGECDLVTMREARILAPAATSSVEWPRHPSMPDCPHFTSRGNHGTHALGSFRGLSVLPGVKQLE